MAKKMERMEIMPAENGGHTITHQMKRSVSSKRMGYMTMAPESETNTFGPGEHDAVIAHVAKHLGLQKEEEGDCPYCGE